MDKITESIDQALAEQSIGTVIQNIANNLLIPVQSDNLDMMMLTKEVSKLMVAGKILGAYNTNLGASSVQFIQSAKDMLATVNLDFDEDDDYDEEDEDDDESEDDDDGYEKADDFEEEFVENLIDAALGSIEAIKGSWERYLAKTVPMLDSAITILESLTRVFNDSTTDNYTFGKTFVGTVKGGSGDLEAYSQVLSDAIIDINPVEYINHAISILNSISNDAGGLTDTISSFYAKKVDKLNCNGCLTHAVLVGLSVKLTVSSNKIEFVTNESTFSQMGLVAEHLLQLAKVVHASLTLEDNVLVLLEEAESAIDFESEKDEAADTNKVSAYCILVTDSLGTQKSFIDTSVDIITTGTETLNKYINAIN